MVSLAKIKMIKMMKMMMIKIMMRSAAAFVQLDNGLIYLVFSVCINLYLLFCPFQSTLGSPRTENLN